MLNYVNKWKYATLGRGYENNEERKDERVLDILREKKNGYL
jgi:hypothetical protein